MDAIYSLMVSVSLSPSYNQKEKFTKNYDRSSLIPFVCVWRCYSVLHVTSIKIALRSVSNGIKFDLDLSSILIYC